MRRLYLIRPEDEDPDEPGPVDVTDPEPVEEYAGPSWLE